MKRGEEKRGFVFGCGGFFFECFCLLVVAWPVVLLNRNTTCTLQEKKRAFGARRRLESVAPAPPPPALLLSPSIVGAHVVLTVRIDNTYETYKHHTTLLSTSWERRGNTRAWRRLVARVTFPRFYLPRATWRFVGPATCFYPSREAAQSPILCTGTVYFFALCTPQPSLLFRRLPVRCAVAHKTTSCFELLNSGLS
jgi:hypothetical protein